MGKKLLCMVLLALCGRISGAHTPPQWPVSDWPQLAALLADPAIPPEWRGPNNISIAALHMVYGSEKKAMDYLRRDKSLEMRKKGNKGSRSGMLLTAISLDKQSIVRTLLEMGETPNAISPMDGSPLMQATAYERLEIMRMLIKAGADVNYTEAESGIRVIDRALTSGKYLSLRLLVDAGVDLKKYRTNELQDSLVELAIDGGSTNILYFLKENGFDMSSQRANGQTPLTYAISIGASYYMVSHLMYAGNPCIKNKEGQLPEQMAKNMSPRDGSGDTYGLLDGACKEYERRQAIP